MYRPRRSEPRGCFFIGSPTRWRRLSAQEQPALRISTPKDESHGASVESLGPGKVNRIQLRPYQNPYGSAGPLLLRHKPIPSSRCLDTFIS
ncbi:hypothetical protein STEG23_031571 [Scotinomys teguina]